MQFDVVKFETSNPRLQEVYRDTNKDPKGRTVVYVYFNPDDEFYYAKGPFATRDAECYEKIGKSKSDAVNWINDYEKRNYIKREFTIRKI